MSERGDVVDSMLVTVPELTKDSTFWKRSLTGTPLNRLLLFCSTSLAYAPTGFAGPCFVLDGFVQMPLSTD